MNKILFVLLAVGLPVLVCGNATVGYNTGGTPPLATTTTAGTVIVPVANNLTVDGSGNIGVPLGSATTFGVVKVDNSTITASGGVIAATGSLAGTQLLAQAASTQSFTGNINANIIFGTVTHSSGITVTSTTSFTIVTAGLYLIEANLSASGSATANFNEQIIVNSTTVAVTQGTLAFCCVSALVRLAVNDVITISGGSGSSFTTFSTIPPRLSIVQLSL